MKLEVNSVNINRNMTEVQLFGSADTMNLEGKLEITGKAILTEGTLQEVDNAARNNTKMDLYASAGNDGYILKNCHITGYDFSMSPNGNNTSSIDIVAEDYAPAIIEIEFKDGKKKVQYKHYFHQVEYLNYDEHNRAKFKKMTYEEFMDRVMVDEL